MTQDTQWQVRARILADERQAIGTARRVGQGVGGSTLYKVPSRSHPGCYLVTFWPNSGQVVCECSAGEHERPCYHAGAVMLEREAELIAELRAQRTHVPAPGKSVPPHGGEQIEPSPPRRGRLSHEMESLAERREHSPIARPVHAGASLMWK